MRKHLPFLFLLLLIVGCQEEVPIDLPTNPPVVTPAVPKDSIATMVMEGDYGGGSFDYDSVVLQYASGQVTFRHHTRTASLMATETIQYDASGRVARYLFSNPVNGSRAVRRYTYSDADPVPSVIDDTLYTGSETEIGQVRTTERTLTGSEKAFTYHNAFQYVNQPIFNSTQLSSGTFNPDWRLTSYQVPNRSQSAYFYNAAGDVDSCYTLTSNGSDETYFSASYTAQDNPLARYSKLVFKNLSNYVVTDNLDNGHLETMLDICFFPSELLAAKVPAQTKQGHRASQIDEEGTYNFIMADGTLKEIVVSHKETATGKVSHTRFRFHY